ncbi:MAG: fused MFS/spermidine synthase, partial [Myxococcota bacterium]
VVTAIALGGALLLPGSFCLGGTLAALVESRRRRFVAEPDGRGLGRLYAANTLGATVGVVLTVHVVLPAAGMGLGAALLAGIGLLAVLAARTYRQQAGPAPDPETADAASRPAIDTSGDPDPDVGNEPWLPHLMLFGTGLVGVGLEVVGVRILSQVLENTIYTFADVLAVYLLGTAVGAALYGRYAAKAIAGKPATVAAGLIIAVAVTVVVAAMVMGRAQGILDALAGDGASYAAHLWAEAVLAALVFGLPTIVMGAVFSHFTGLVAEHGVGRAYALNTLGSAAAPLVFGVWAIGNFGYTDGLYVVVYAYLGLFGLFTWFRRFKPAFQIGAILGVVALTALAPKSLVLVQTDDGWETLSQHETLLGLVIVSEQTDSDPPQRRLQVDKQFRMGGARAVGERRMGHLPLLLAPQAERALFLGVGTGATAGAALSYPTIAHIDAVELVPAVLEELHHFEGINGKLHEAGGVDLHAADARRFVAASEAQWDVVVADLFHPARDGAGNLYAREHFEHVAARLSDDGLFAQWVPMYQLDGASLRMVVRTFCEVFGEVHSFLGIYNVQNPALVLIGRDPGRASGPLTVDLSALQARLAAPVYGELLMADARDLLAGYMLDRDALLAFAGEGPLSTDLHPRISLTAPRGAYIDDSSRGPDNLRAVLEARRGIPATLVSDADPARLAQFAEQRTAFATALGQYLEGEFTRLADAPDAPISMAAIEHFLAAHRTAPQFVAARGMLYVAAQQGRAQADTIYPALIEVGGNDPRPYQTYLQYLKSIGDQTRFDAVLAEAQAKFPQPPAPPSTPDPPPMLRP